MATAYEEKLSAELSIKARGVVSESKSSFFNAGYINYKLRARVFNKSVLVEFCLPNRHPLVPVLDVGNVVEIVGPVMIDLGLQDAYLPQNQYIIDLDKVVFRVTLLSKIRKLREVL